MRPSEPASAAETAARERLGRLFTSFDRLTPDELARIGYRMASDAEREPLLAALDQATDRTGRQALADEARELARDAVLRRYAAGAFHPTFVGLNWGLSQGPVEDRVSIAETLADAAAAAVVEDVLDPEVAEAFALDASGIIGLAAGTVSEGSFERVLRVPDDPELGPSRSGRAARIAVAGAMVVLVGLGAGVGGVALAAGAAGAVLLGTAAIRVLGRSRD